MVGSRKTMAADLHLPDECWECVFRFINGDHRCLESLSLVSKQFLSITNRLRFSLTICDQTLPFLPLLFHRFPTLTSLDLTRFRGDLDELLRQISHFPLHLRSLNLSNHSTVPVNGLQALREKTKTLTSFTCSNMGYLIDTNMFHIANCFPFLEELDLSFPKAIAYSDYGLKFLSSKLPKLRKVNLSGNFELSDLSLFYLCKNCELLEEVVLFDCKLITHAGIASAIRERPSLRWSFSVTRFGVGTSPSISSLVSLKGLTWLDLSFSSLWISDKLLFSIAEEALPVRKLLLQGCRNYTYAGIFCLLSKCQFVQHLDLQNAEFLNDQCVAELSWFLGDLVSINVSGCKMLTESALFALLKSCPLLSEIRMGETCIGKRHVEDYNFLMDVVINSHYQVKSLHLACNSWLRDESIIMFASICPNLQLLDLSSCYGISEGVGEVLRRCCKIRHLSLVFCSGVKLLRMNFEVPKLEVLNLSQSRIDDEDLFVISKSCCGLLQLDLEKCYDVTEKGVMLVVENCTQLREINLRYCHNVAADVVANMVFSRPSLRKITAPPFFRPSDSQRELLLRHIYVDVVVFFGWNLKDNNLVVKLDFYFDSASKPREQKKWNAAGEKRRNEDDGGGEKEWGKEKERRRRWSLSLTHQLLFNTCFLCYPSSPFLIYHVCLPLTNAFSLFLWCMRFLTLSSHPIAPLKTQQ